MGIDAKNELDACARCHAAPNLNYTLQVLIARSIRSRDRLPQQLHNQAQATPRLVEQLVAPNATLDCFHIQQILPLMLTRVVKIQFDKP